MTPLQKLPKDVRDLDKLIVSKGFKKLLKVQKIATSGHTEPVAKYDTRKHYDLKVLSTTQDRMVSIRLSIDQFPFAALFVPSVTSLHYKPTYANLHS